MRRIIQIAVGADSPTKHETLYALCDDWTVWSKNIATGETWKRIEDVPQCEPGQPQVEPAPPATKGK